MAVIDIELVALDRQERRWFLTVFILLIASAWLLLLAPGITSYTDHSRVFEELSPGTAATRFLPFLGVWTLTMWAMMLPSTLNTQAAVTKVAARQGIGSIAPVLFSLGYLSVWAAFGVIAFAGDYAVHTLVDRTPYLHDHELLVTGSVVTIAGLYQFTPLKDACLNSCRSPLAFILARSKRGRQGLVMMGADHGLFCLGCCWALMLLMFAFSASSLVLMALMAAYFFAEKAVKNTESLGHMTGTLALSGGAVLLLRGFNLL